MAVEFGIYSVSGKRKNRWFAIVFLGIAVVAFVGISLLPFAGALQRGSQAGSSPAASPASPASAQANLEAQAKGYETVLQREPTNRAALQGLVDTRLAQGNIQGFIAFLEELAALHPGHSEHQILLAQAKQQIGDQEGAAQAYRTILEKQPGDINALTRLAELLMQQQRPDAAISLLQDTLQNVEQTNQANPNSVDVLSVQLLLGDVYAAQQQYTEAMAIYQQVAQVAPQDFRFRPVFAQALLLQRQGKAAEAQPLFTQAEQLAPAEYKSRIKLAATGIPAASPTPTGTPTGEASPVPGADTPAPAAASPSPTASP
jgi:tetratricopeptide (TPR) repeat protein